MTASLLDAMLVVLMLLNFFNLGTTRIRALIQMVAVQGVLLGLMPLLLHAHLGIHIVLLALATIGVKGAVIPGLLTRAMRDLSIRREVEPLISPTPSLLLGALGTALALAFASQLPLVEADTSRLLVPASLATVLAGFILLTTRIQAITQVVGYLVLENGIFIFGLLLLEAMPFLVEVGVLLDLFVGIFIMGIMINHINREFASVSTEHLSSLKE